MTARLSQVVAADVPEPPRDCPLCPRLVQYRRENQATNPEWYNGPAPSFGDPQARLLVLGLAPGRKGANRTGRPFTGDYAGKLLYETLDKFGFSQGRFDARVDDGVRLIDCMLSNAVRCAPPGNKPLPEEEATCRRFLAARLAALPRLKAVVCLGDVSRRNLLKAVGMKASAAPAGHGLQFQAGPYRIFSSYHCSRLNTNTGRLTTPMFEAVFADVRAYLDDL
ncbi:MAG: Uracil-DNA glycosylase [Caulobacteraceae bacterium]|nr:Uracil-DNA glycosylase [Caulobacteraceae bacterium]